MVLLAFEPTVMILSKGNLRQLIQGNTFLLSNLHESFENKKDKKALMIYAYKFIQKLRFLAFL